MSTTKSLTVEVCANGTITRACARTLNNALAGLLPASDGQLGYCRDLSGTTPATLVTAFLREHGFAFRVLDAAALTGADKARHTRAVTKSARAQARRAGRAVVAMEGESDAGTLALLGEYVAKRVSA